MKDIKIKSRSGEELKFVEDHSKIMRERYEDYKRSIARDGLKELYDVYDSCSNSKRKAWAYCGQLCKRACGYDLTICGKNQFQFSAGFVFEDADDVKWFVYITKDYDKVMRIVPEK